MVVDLDLSGLPVDICLSALLSLLRGLWEDDDSLYVAMARSEVFSLSLRIELYTKMDGMVRLRHVTGAYFA
jgi:hypothetical protein